MKKYLLFCLSIFLISITSAQTLVSTQPENKNVVLEEFTGIHCTFCPDGHVVAQGIYDNNPGDVVLVNIHAGSYANPSAGEPDFRTTFGTAIDGQAGVSGYPAGTVNRHQFSMSQGGGTAMSRGDWNTASTQILATPSPVNVGAQASVDMSSGILTVDVEVYYTGWTGSAPFSNMLNVAVLQNNVPGPQTGAASFNPGAIIPGQWNPTYNHQHMLRHLMTGQWGEQISTISVGTLVSRQYTWALPADINGVALDPTNLEVAAFVSEGQQEIYTGISVSPSVIFPNSYDAYCMSVSANDVLCSSTTDLEISFRNYGSLILTSLDINYSINGGATITYPWTGSLAPAGTETISIPGVSFVPNANSSVSVSVANPNGNIDQNSSNDNATTTFVHANSAGQVQAGFTSGNALIELTTDQYSPQENTWELIDDAGNVVASNGALTANAVQTPVYANLQSNSCYKVAIYDSYGDGICCTYGNGEFNVTDASGSLILHASNFGSVAEQAFSTSSVTPSWDCNNGACVPNMSGTGIYGTLAACQAACAPAPSWNCINGTCIDPGTGLGQYSSQAACQAACIILPSWDCDPNTYTCSDPGTGQGLYGSLASCQAACAPAPSWDCDPSTYTCSDPGTGNGAYTTLAGCQASCAPPASWNCISSNNCVDPGDGTGQFTSQTACTTFCAQPVNSYNCVGGNCIGYPGTGGMFSTVIACLQSIASGTGPCNTTAIDENENFGISIYPNPVKNILHITGVYESLEIYDILGKMIYSTDVFEQEILVDNFKNGLYILNIITKDAILTKRIAVEK